MSEIEPKKTGLDWTGLKRSDFRQSLLDWYDVNQRQLPWRETSEPYRIWVSEVMLQQTQVKTVIDYYLRFIDQFPTIADLARAELSAAIKLWEGLGYYSRIRNFHKAAGVVLDSHDGIVPQDYQQFKALPGVGDYIAAAVMSIAFGQAVAVVDGNVKRVLGRLLKLHFPVNRSSSTKLFQQIANGLLDHGRPGDYNQALMELGAMICIPKSPICDICPVSSFCEANINGEVAEFPITVPRRKVPTKEIAVGIILKNDQFLITLRRDDGMLGGLWEFPGGKVKEGERLMDACLREIKEETNLRVTIQQKLPAIRHAYTHFKIVLTPFVCSYESGDLMLDGPVDFRWIGINAIDDFAFPKANHKIFPNLKKYLKE